MTPKHPPLLPPPVPLGDDDALLAWLDWLGARDLQPYAHQEEAFLEVFSGRHVVLSTPTGSGKSLVAQALHWRALCRGEQTIYTAPIKALANEKFFELCAIFGPDQVGLLTGDATVHRDAPILCCTAEILGQMALEHDAPLRKLHVAMDEFHYYADRDRGMAWQVPLLRLESATFLLMSATLGDTTAIAKALQARTGRDVAHVTSVDRPVPLHFQYLELPLHEVVAQLIVENKAPCYLVHFSHRDASESAGALMSIDVCTKDEKRQIAEQLHGERWPSPYGKTLQRLIRHGIGLHHAGLLPRYRRLVEKLAQTGLIKVICGTDTLGIGINVPLRTVVLTKLCKFDGEKTRLLQVRELQQIAGRAGRKGFDDRGWVIGLAPEHVVANKRLESKVGRDGKSVKFVRQKPPEKGYVAWDETTFRRLSTGQPEPLQPVFALSVGTVAQVLRAKPDDAAVGLRTVADLIGRSHLHPGGQIAQRRELGRIGRSLRQAGVLQVFSSKHGGSARLNPELQEDFSLHHALSLFLVESLRHLDDQHRTEFGPDHPDADLLWAADVCSVTESILDNPMPVLNAQVHAEKGHLIAEMKAAGVPFEERQERLEGITWPKPLAEWLYTQLDQFTERHPWLTQEAVRPKAVVRQLFDAWATFDEAVRNWDLEPAEGVLLRYLSQAYKTLLQNVPERWQSPMVWQLIGYLRAVIGATDSSLVQEWEALRDGRQFQDGGQALPDAPRKADPTRDPKALQARLRAEMLQAYKALVAGDLEALGRAVRPGAQFGPSELSAWQAAQEAPAVWDHRARLGDHCQLRMVAARHWQVTQTVFDADGPTEGRIVAELDLRGVDASELPDGPLLSWVAAEA